MGLSKWYFRTTDEGMIQKSGWEAGVGSANCS